MPQPDRPLTRVCLRLYESDYEKLRLLSRSNGDQGINQIVREIIHSYVTNLTDLENQSLSRTPTRIPDLSPELLFELATIED